MQLLIDELLIKKSSVLDNSDIFAKFFKIFHEGRDGGGVGVTFLTKLSEMSSFLRGIAKYVS